MVSDKATIYSQHTKGGYYLNRQSAGYLHHAVQIYTTNTFLSKLRGEIIFYSNKDAKLNMYASLFLLFYCMNGKFYSKFNLNLKLILGSVARNS